MYVRGMTMTRTIQRAAAETGLTADTLRYYERIGILPGIGRSESGHRRFTDDDMGWIKLVQCLRATGMPLEDLHRYAELVQEGEDTAGERLALLEAHKARIQSEMGELAIALDLVERKTRWLSRARRARATSCRPTTGRRPQGPAADRGLAERRSDEPVPEAVQVLGMPRRPAAGSRPRRHSARRRRPGRRA